MNTLERLKELSATTGQRNSGEDLGHWADREKRENMWVRDVALPDLLAVVEAAWEYRYLCDALHAAQVNSKAEWEAHKKALEAEARLDAALAKLEKEG